MWKFFGKNSQTFCHTLTLTEASFSSASNHRTFHLDVFSFPFYKSTRETYSKSYVSNRNNVKMSWTVTFQRLVVPLCVCVCVAEIWFLSKMINLRNDPQIFSMKNVIKLSLELVAMVTIDHSFHNFSSIQRGNWWSLQERFRVGPSRCPFCALWRKSTLLSWRSCSSVSLKVFFKM